MQRTNICFPLQLYKRLTEYKRRTGLSLGEIVRRAVEDFLTRQEVREVRES